MKMNLLSGRRLTGRLFCCLIALMAAVPPAWAAGPGKTTIAESLFGSKNGNDKKQAALPFIGAALSMTEALTNREIVDEAKFRDGLSKVIDGVVACLNASAWAKSQ